MSSPCVDSCSIFLLTGVSSLPDKDAFSILDFQLSTFKFQISLSIVNYFGLLLRSFPVATPFLPRSYLVPTPNLFQTFRLVVPLLSACYFLAIGLLLRTLPQCCHDVSTYSNCQLEFSTFNSQLSTKKIVNCQLSIVNYKKSDLRPFFFQTRRNLCGLSECACPCRTFAVDSRSNVFPKQTG